MYDLVLAVVGYCSVRKNEKYNIEKVRCLILVCAYLWVMNLVGLIIQILVLIDPTELESIASWNVKMSLFTSFLDFVVYIAGAYFDKQLYDELRLNYTQAEVNLAGRNNPFFGGGGYGNQQAQPSNNQGNIPPGRSQGRDLWSQPAPTVVDKGFVPFQGEGHRLGGPG